MSLFRSVVADARPRKSNFNPLGGGSLAKTGLDKPGVIKGVGDTNGKSQREPVRTVHLSHSIPNQVVSSSDRMESVKIPSSEGDNSIVEQSVQNIGGEINILPTSPGTSDISAPILDGGDVRRVDSDFFPANEPDSKVEIGRETERSLAYQDPKRTVEKIEPLFSPVNIEITHQSKLTDNDSDKIFQIEKTDIQTDASKITSSRVEEDNSIQETDNQIVIKENNYFKSPTNDSKTDERRSDSSGFVNEQIQTTDNAIREKVESVLPGGKKSSSIVHQQISMENLPNREKTVVFHPVVQDVLQQGEAKIPQKERGSESISATHLADGKVSISSSDKDARRAMKSEELRSAPSKPVRANPIPKDGGIVGSNQRHRLPEKKQEASNVQIGQIDVIIEAAAKPQSSVKLTPASSATDLASSHYLRML